MGESLRLEGNFQSQINDWTIVLKVNCYKRKEDVLVNSMRQLLNFKKFSFLKKNMLQDYNNEIPQLTQAWA
jgi:hypothetical protein